MYSVQQSSSTPNTFYFTTAAGIIYETEFTQLDSDTVPAPFSLARFYLVDVFPLYNPWGELPSQDPLIGQTIATLIQQIIAQDKIAVVYSCETSDPRQKARYRLFNQWFSRYNDGTFLKYDTKIDASTNHYYISALIQHSAESYQLAAQFLQITTDWQQRKPR